RGGQGERRPQNHVEREVLPGSRGGGELGEVEERFHDQRSSFRAWSIRRESRSRSSSVSFAPGSPSNAATACAVEPSQHVCTSWRRADRRALSRGTVGRKTYRGPSCSCRKCPFSSRTRSRARMEGY